MEFRGTHSSQRKHTWREGDDEGDGQRQRSCGCVSSPPFQKQSIGQIHCSFPKPYHHSFFLGTQAYCSSGKDSAKHEEMRVRRGKKKEL